jgi:hypothetical protein
MARCEDYPCCGHEPDDCPDSQGRMKCVGCGKRIPKNRPNSYCSDRCMRRDIEREDDGQFYERFHYGEY